ncbi:MAG: hypothetical protein NC099_05665 [Corallococcus sp.]|nr:hypothetical protein [Corallococcus sp.]
MNEKIVLKCHICGATAFVSTSIGEILATEGYFNVNAYACQNCGHIELFAPHIDAIAKQKRMELRIQSEKKE